MRKRGKNQKLHPPLSQARKSKLRCAMQLSVLPQSHFLIWSWGRVLVVWRRRRRRREVRRGEEGGIYRL